MLLNGDNSLFRLALVIGNESGPDFKFKIDTNYGDISQLCGMCI